MDVAAAGAPPRAEAVAILEEARDAAIMTAESRVDDVFNLEEGGLGGTGAGLEGVGHPGIVAGQPGIVAGHPGGGAVQEPPSQPRPRPHGHCLHHPHPHRDGSVHARSSRRDGVLHGEPTEPQPLGLEVVGAEEEDILELAVGLDGGAPDVELREERSVLVAPLRPSAPFPLTAPQEPFVDGGDGEDEEDVDMELVLRAYGLGGGGLVGEDEGPGSASSPRGGRVPSSTLTSMTARAMGGVATPLSPPGTGTRSQASPLLTLLMEGVPLTDEAGDAETPDAGGESEGGSASEGGSERGATPSRVMGSASGVGGDGGGGGGGHEAAGPQVVGGTLIN